MSDELKEIEGLLVTELEKERAANARNLKVSGVLVLLVAGYLAWINSAIGTLLDPQGIAEATSGAALTAVPAAGQEIRKLVVDGAPELMRMGSDQLIALIPAYRETLQGEIDPVLNQVATVLADTAMENMAQKAGNPSSQLMDDAAIGAAADAAVEMIDVTLDAAMDTPDDEGQTPRQRIEVSLTQLKKIDTELKRIAKKGGDPAERELLLAWLNVVTSNSRLADRALIEDVKASGVR